MYIKSTNPSTQSTKQAASTSPNPASGQTLPSSKGTLFESENTSFRGKITKIDDKKLILENHNGVMGELQLADKITIYDLNKAGGAPSSDLKEIRLNTSVLIDVIPAGNEFLAVAITYPQP